MTRPRVTLAQLRTAQALARRLYVDLTEAAHLLGLTPAGRLQDPVLMLDRWRSALAAAEAVDKARARAAATVAAP